MPEAPKNIKAMDDVVLDEKNKKSLEFIEDVTINADQVQKRVLADILTSNAGVEYLRRHGLNGHIDDELRESFKKVMPVVTYEDLKHDVERIANGDTSSILCSRPISEFLTRSVPSFLAFIYGKFLPYNLSSTKV